MGEFFGLNGQICEASLRVRKNSELEATVTNWKRACVIGGQAISSLRWGMGRGGGRP